MRHANTEPHCLRRAAMAVLANAPAAELQRLWQEAQIEVEAVAIRGPETGQVTVRGRMGGGGAAFNLGEATLTRASFRLPTGEIGHSCALGRDRGKARIAAIIDALLQRPQDAERIERRVIGPLRAARDARNTRRNAEAAATKVDFFTLVRGED